MNSKLSEFFPWSSESCLKGKFLLLLDEQVPGSNHNAEFLLTYLLLKYLSPNRSTSQRLSSPPIVLILCNHSYNHYEAILRKNFIDPRQCVSSGLLHVIQLHSLSSDKNNKLNSSLPNRLDKDLSWEELIQWQREGMQLKDLTDPRREEEQEQEDYILLIDDLDLLELLAPSFMEARHFLRQGLQYLSSSSSSPSYMEGNDSGHDRSVGCMKQGKEKKPIHMIAGYGRHPAESRLVFQSMDLSRSDHEEEATSSTSTHPPMHEGSSNPRLTEYLRYRCAVSVVACPLKTGSSSAVHGIIYIKDQTASNKAVQPANQKKEMVLQYKALDSGVLSALARL